LNDADYLDSEARKTYSSLSKPYSKFALNSLHPAILSRVLIMIAKDNGVNRLEFTHISRLMQLLKGDNFSYYLPGDIIFCCSRGIISFKEEIFEPLRFYKQDILSGVNEISNTNGIIILSDSVIKTSSNIYNFSIHANLSSAIIKGGLFVRTRLPGDSYRYGGITHKLKKVFNDRNIPSDERDTIPIICDDDGIVWVPGLGVRDDGGNGDGPFVAFCTKSISSPGDIELTSALLRKN
jgi:tRNA(Ile)-lysidine synthase